MRTKILHITILWVLTPIVYFSQVQPQKPGQPNDLDNKYSPGNSPVFKISSGSNTVKSSTSSGDVEFKNAIKFNLALLPRKIAAFGYERSLNENIGLETWLGYNYGIDPIFTALGSELDFMESSSNSVISLSNMFQYGTHYSGGLFYGGNVRFNFESYYWNTASTYLSIGLRGYSQKMDLNSRINEVVVSSSTKFIGSTIAEVRQMNYLMTYGYRLVTEGKIKTSHEFYFSFGLRSVSYTRYENFETNFGIYEVRPAGNKGKFSSFFFAMGYNFGIGF